MRVVLGNRNAVQGVLDADGEVQHEVLPSKGRQNRRALEVVPDEGKTLSEVFTDITHPRGVWAAHTTEDATPAWVASDDENMANLLSAHFGGIEIRELDVNPPHGRGSGGAAAAAGTALVSMLLAVLLLTFLRLNPFLKTNAGNDFQAKQMGGAASATGVAKWMALTANSTAPAAGDTTLTAEIATGGGGLVRAAGTYGHTTGAASYTITNTFTANGSDSLPVTIAKAGIFDASVSGNLVFEDLVSPTATLSASGDSLTLTSTITL